MKPIQFTTDSGREYRLSMDHHGIWWMYVYLILGGGEYVLIDLFSLGPVAERAEREFLSLAYSTENPRECLNA